MRGKGTAGLLEADRPAKVTQFSNSFFPLVGKIFVFRKGYVPRAGRYQARQLPSRLRSEQRGNLTGHMLPLAGPSYSCLLRTSLIALCCNRLKSLASGFGVAWRTPARVFMRATPSCLYSMEKSQDFQEVGMRFTFSLRSYLTAS